MGSKTKKASRPVHSLAAADQAAVQAQNWKLLQQFNLYRLILALALVGAASAGAAAVFGLRFKLLFLITSGSYSALALVAIFAIRWRWFGFVLLTTLLVLTDIASISLLMFASGGLGSGLGLLLLVSVAECSVLMGRRTTMFFASLATIAALGEHSAGALIGSANELSDVIHGFPKVGVLGIGLFITATLGNSLASRLRSTAALAERQSRDLASLANINDLIIERMQSGVLVCDTTGILRQMNRAARTFLGLDDLSLGHSLAKVAPDLAAEMVQWRKNPVLHGRQLVRTDAGYTLLPRFIVLGSETNHLGFLIFLDNTEVLKQQAQQLKMAALARLTASIAHEIRNPLAAITHAAQLLKETVSEGSDDARLIKIIENHGQRMNVIVENITQLARRDHSEPRRLRLHPWLNEFVNQYVQGAHIPREAIRVLPEGQNVESCFDQDQLYQVVGNLCQNALRHSPPFSGEALIELRVGMDAQERPILEVLDRGPGVPPENRETIFDPFFTTSPGGTGLGLYISRELCEGNGGRLDYLPRGESGSNFRITMAPAKECSEQTIK
ncbi:MAG: ATP-binding protein [Acidiferrobacteraceae bacterium]|jgi:two-component system sensor histidine kinase PilS (NtrC family)